MKTLRLVFVLTIISIATVVYSGITPKKKQFSVAITLSEAIQKPDLVQTMYIQLDDDFLKDRQNRNKVIVQQVVHVNTVYVISGTFEEWILFFLMDNMTGNTLSQVNTNTHK